MVKSILTFHINDIEIVFDDICVDIDDFVEQMTVDVDSQDGPENFFDFCREDD